MPQKERHWRWMLCFLSLFFCQAAFSASPSDETFKQANAAYNAGKFTDAATLYETARQAGLRHWVLYYNLGNADYKNGQIGKAIANYYRAFRLNSANRDIIYNLNLTTTRAGDPVVPSGALPALFWKMFFMLPINTLTLLASLIFILGVSGCGFWLAGRWRPTQEVLIFSLLVILWMGGWLGVRIYFNERPEGVIAGGVGEVRSGPNTTYPANFTVPEGHRVLILDEQEPVTGWVEIGVPEQGLKGWIPTSLIEII